MTNSVHVSDAKKKVVKEFVDLINSYPIVGAVNLENMPAAQLQNMRSILRGEVVLRMTKRRLIKIALGQCKKEGIDKITEHLRGMPALLFTKQNPFKLYKQIQRNKSKAPAKGGQTAPNDIVVSAGPTSFAPGPIIGELGGIGLKTGVENGKVAIQEDKVVVKEGDVIAPKTAELLTRLGIEPMEIGLDLVATFEDGTIFTKDVLAIDEVKFMEDLTNAGKWAFNLSVEAGYPVKDNIDFLLGKCYTDSKGLALEANILADAVVGDLLEKAERQMLSLKDAASIEVAVKPKEIGDIKGEKDSKIEEKKEEPKVGDNTEKKVKELQETAEEVKKDVEEVKKDVEFKLQVSEPELKEEIKETEKAAEQVKELVKDKVAEIEKKDEVVLQEIKEVETKVESGQDVTDDIKKIEIEEAQLKEKVEEIKMEVQDLKKENIETDQTPDVAEKVKEEAKQVKKIVDNIPDAAQLEAKKIVEAPLKEEEKIEKELRESEVLFEELKKKGTLRDSSSTPNLKVKDVGKTVTESGEHKDDVPSAHELAAKLKKKS